MVSLKTVCDFLLDNDNYLILTHRNPDGDTLGSAYALALALKKLSKKVTILCDDKIPEKYSYFTKTVKLDKIKKPTIIAVDIATPKLLGSLEEQYGNKIQLSIDHHKTNSNYAEISYVDETSAANCEIIYNLIKKLKVEITDDMAKALYTGISTDTGCFRYSNTTEKTHKIAAELMKFNIESSEIDRLMFETKSIVRLELEKLALKNLELYSNGLISLVSISKKDFAKTGCKDDEFEGITSISRSVEGVLIAITMRELKSGKIKASVRSFEPIDAAVLCEKMGGGGHARAAGCELSGNLRTTKKTILKYSYEILKENKVI